MLTLDLTAVDGGVTGAVYVADVLRENLYILDLVRLAFRVKGQQLDSSFLVKVFSFISRLISSEVNSTPSGYGSVATRYWWLVHNILSASVESKTVFVLQRVQGGTVSW